MANTFGKNLKTTIFGQSHGEAIGVVLEGVPAGIRLDLERIRTLLARRAPGQNAFSTPRKEADEPEILSGLVDGVTCGAPLCAVIRNNDTRSRDYDALRRVPRPSHADYTAWVKFGGHNDVRGGGQFSGRLTAPLCFAGAVAMQLLADRGVTVAAHALRIGGVADDAPDMAQVTAADLAPVAGRAFPTLSEARGQKMQAAIEAARQAGDSVGGVIRCYAFGVPAGLGEPMFDGVENLLARAVFAIPGIRGVSFGTGFGAADLRGSEHNDPFCWEDGQVRTETNHHGGILGGITSGMPIVMDVAVKPTASIALPQRSVDLTAGTETELTIQGRHDPCIVPRAVPCVEAAMALTLADLLLGSEGSR